MAGAGPCTVGDVGTVVSVSGENVTVNFASQSGWKTKP